MQLKKVSKASSVGNRLEKAKKIHIQTDELSKSFADLNNRATKVRIKHYKIKSSVLGYPYLFK